MKSSELLLSYWSAKQVWFEISNDEDLDNGEMNHENYLDTDKDSSWLTQT